MTDRQPITNAERIARGLKPLGRKRKTELDPNRFAPMHIQVWDRRPEVSSKMIFEDRTVPWNWNVKMILERFGIADHLTVLRRGVGDVEWSIIQTGRIA